ncbi:hypothetical protein GQ457_09G014050 [Hibiscus cannabinus]
MNKGGVYVKHAVIFSRKRGYGVYLTPQLGSKSLASLLLSFTPTPTPTPTPSLTPTAAVGCLSQHQSSVTRTAVRRLQSSTIAADHPLKLLQPPNPKR